MQHIEALVADSATITVAAVDEIECAATTAGQHNALMMLARRKGETIAALLKRLERGCRYPETGETVAKVNSANDCSPRRRGASGRRSRAACP
jgi:hypothetical protein